MPDSLLNAFRDRLCREAGPALWHDIERAANARIDAVGEHAQWARLAEEAGLVNLAFREFQLALRDDPHDADAAFRLAQHYRERGDTGRAAALIELLQHCPVLAELKRTVDEHRRLSHEEQLVLIHTLGHVEGGPQAVNYLFGKCLDVGPEKHLKDRLKGNPVSCPSIRKKIGHITRRVPCNCPFDFAPDRYPTPVLHLLTLPATEAMPSPTPADDAATLARRYAASAVRLAEIQREHHELARALAQLLRWTPERTVFCPGGRYRLIEQAGVEELIWEEDSSASANVSPPS